MAKKIDAKLEKRLKNLGITAKSEDDARKKLVAKLEKEGIEGMEEEDLENLIDMVESFVEDDNDTEENDDVDTEETSEEESDDDEDDDIEALADEVEAEEAEDSDDDEDDEEEDEEPAPAPKKASKKEEKPAKKAAEKPAKKETKKAEPKKTASKRGVKLDPKNNEDDREAFNELQELFGEGYQLDWLSSFGLTVKHIGKNGKRGVLTLENATKHDDGRITCNLYLLTMTKETEKLDELGIDYELCWTKAPFMKGITLEEALDILKKVFEIITGFASTVDKRLGDNRKKMEDNLKKSGKKASTKASKEVEPEDEEDDEEEDEEPVKKPAKKVAKKSKK